MDAVGFVQLCIACWDVPPAPWRADLYTHCSLGCLRGIHHTVLFTICIASADISCAWHATRLAMTAKSSGKIKMIMNLEFGYISHVSVENCQAKRSNEPSGKEYCTFMTLSRTKVKRRWSLTSLGLSNGYSQKSITYRVHT